MRGLLAADGVLVAVVAAGFAAAVASGAPSGVTVPAAS
jgi:hypothetical protein